MTEALWSVVAIDISATIARGETLAMEAAEQQARVMAKWLVAPGCEVVLSGREG